MEQVKKIVLMAFDEIDDAMEYCRMAKDEQDRDMSQGYSNIGSSKLGNATTLLAIAKRHVENTDGDGSQQSQSAKDVLDVLSEIVDGRIQSANRALSSIER